MRIETSVLMNYRYTSAYGNRPIKRSFQIDAFSIPVDRASMHGDRSAANVKQPACSGTAVFAARRPVCGTGAVNECDRLSFIGNLDYPQLVVAGSPGGNGRRRTRLSRFCRGSAPQRVPSGPQHRRGHLFSRQIEIDCCVIAGKGAQRQTRRDVPLDASTRGPVDCRND